MRLRYSIRVMPSAAAASRRSSSSPSTECNRTPASRVETDRGPTRSAAVIAQRQLAVALPRDDQERDTRRGKATRRRPTRSSTSRWRTPRKRSTNSPRLAWSSSTTTCQMASRTPRAFSAIVGWRSPSSRTLPETSCPFCSSGSRSPVAVLRDGPASARFVMGGGVRPSRRRTALTNVECPSGPPSDTVDAEPSLRGAWMVAPVNVRARAPRN